MKKIDNKIAIIILLLVSIILTGLVVFKLNNYRDKLSYSDEGVVKQIPTTKKKIKNVIFMIGDGMGENHIIAGERYIGEKLNIQKIKDKTYVTTNSVQKVTDSAAAATALSTGYKTHNGKIGRDISGNDVENLIEYTNKRGLKTGIVCTERINHATPAGFSVHTRSRHNYDRIAKLQIKSCLDLMFGGGRDYFSKYETEMKENNFKWVNNISELSYVDKDSKVIGTFANTYMSKEKERISLADLSREAISRLENENGFFLMIEGSEIDRYSEKENMSKMLKEMIDFDEAVKVAKEYVDKHSDTLLIVTADHETGGLVLEGVTSAEQLTDSLLTTGGKHTNANVPLYAYGRGAKDLTKYSIIDNIDICKFVRQGIANAYEKK